MRKMRVALVILLFLAVIALSQAGMALTPLTAISPMNLGNALTVADNRATLEGIQQQLANGNSNIAATSQQLNALANNMAGVSMTNAENAIQASKTNAFNPTMINGIGVPLSGIGDAIKELGSINVAFSSPKSVLENMQIPKLAVFQ